MLFTLATSNCVKYWQLKRNCQAFHFWKDNLRWCFWQNKTQTVLMCFPRWDGMEACRASAAHSETARCQDLAPLPEAGGAAFRSSGNTTASEDSSGLPDETSSNPRTGTNYTEKNGLKEGPSVSLHLSSCKERYVQGIFWLPFDKVLSKPGV